MAIGRPSDAPVPPPPSAPPARPQAEERPRSVKLSVGVGLALGGVVLATLFAGRLAFFAFAVVVVVVAQAELYAVLKANGQTPAVLIGLVSGGVMLVGTYQWGATALAMLVALPLPLVGAWMLTTPPQRARSTLSSTYLGILYGPFLASFAVLLLRGRDGLVLTAAYVGMTAVFDAGGYLVGRKLGRHPMSRISPRKSWEGLAAGAATCVGLSAAFLPLVHPFDLRLSVRMALVVSATAPLGDLAESLLKRDLGVKDMGTLVPGHGGLFDRIDAILFGAPVAYGVLRVAGWA